MSSVFPHRMPRMKLCTYVATLGLLLSVAILTACGGSSTSTPKPSKMPCATDHSIDDGEIRYWVRDTVALSLVSSVLPFPPITQTSLDNTLSFLLQGTGITPDQGSETAVVAIHRTAIAFVKLTPQSGKDCVVRAVDTINGGIGSPSGTTLLNGPSTVKLVSASPDFYINEQGMDHIGGSPGGPPTWTAGSSPKPITPIASGGKSTVYILDTVDPIPPGSATPLASSLAPLCGGDTNCGSMVDELKGPGTVYGQYVPLQDETIIGPYGSAPSIREHGVFSTAIIHYLAGEATVHLIRVLNDHGVGDLQSLANGLAMVKQDASNPSPVYVNLSLTIVPPLRCLADVLQNYVNYETGQGFGDCAVPQDQLFSLDPIVNTLGRPIADLLSEGQVVVVAAAGNDSTASARYGQDLPGAFCGVVAVAAATDGVGPNWVYPAPVATPYPTLDPQSNLPNGPCVSLPAVGSYSPPSQVAGDETVALGDNICSLFLGSFPATTNSKGNPIGFAQWSGTSFATAYITGNVASGAIQVLATGAGTGTLDEKMPCIPIP